MNRHLLKTWTHLKRYRDVYLFPLIGVIVLYFAIRWVNHLTGRAVVDDPGAIIGGLYNAMLILVAVAIVGTLQGFQIPDPTPGRGEPQPPWPIHLINVLCTIAFFWLVLHFLFH